MAVGLNKNQNFDDASTSIVDTADTTKALQFQCSGITTGNTRTVTAQDASGTMYISGGTDVPVADGGTGVSSLTAYAPVFGGTTGTGAVQSGTVGNAGEVLTSNGAGALPTFQAISAGESWRNSFSTFFEDLAALEQATTGTGVITLGTTGTLVAAGNGGGIGSAMMKFSLGANTTMDMSTNDPVFSCMFHSSEGANGVGSGYAGFGAVTVASTGITWTPRHFGFANVTTAGPTTDFVATNANGTTRTNTSASGETVNVTNYMVAVYDSGTNIKFYLDDTLIATHTTNLPTTMTGADTSACMQFATTTDNNGTSTFKNRYRCASISWLPV